MALGLMIFSYVAFVLGALFNRIVKPTYLLSQIPLIIGSGLGIYGAYIANYRALFWLELFGLIAGLVSFLLYISPYHKKAATRGKYILILMGIAIIEFTTLIGNLLGIALILINGT